MEDKLWEVTTSKLTWRDKLNNLSDVEHGIVWGLVAFFVVYTVLFLIDVFT